MKLTFTKRDITKLVSLHKRFTGRHFHGSNLIFESRGDGSGGWKLTVTSGGGAAGTITTRRPEGFSVVGAGDGVLDLHDLVRCVSVAKAGDQLILIFDDERATLQLPTGIAAIPLVKRPQIAETPDEWQLLASFPSDRLSAAMRRILHTAAKDDIHRRFLESMRFEFGGSKLINVVSMDGHRMATVLFDGAKLDSGDTSVLIPQPALLGLAEMIGQAVGDDGPADVVISGAVDEGYRSGKIMTAIRIWTPTHTYEGKLIDAEFPPIEHILPMSRAAAILVFPDCSQLQKTLAGLKRTIGKAGSIRFEADDDGVVIIPRKDLTDGENAFADHTRLDIRQRIEGATIIRDLGEDGGIAFNVNYLIAAAKSAAAAGCKVLRIESHGSDLASRMVSDSDPDGDEHFELVMPLRR